MDDTQNEIATVMDFASLVPVAHAMAVRKGWWPEDHNDRDADEVLANYHAEISEAWEEYRGGRMATWYQHDGKPEGFFVELADLVIRIADSVGSRNVHLLQPDSYVRQLLGKCKHLRDSYRKSNASIGAVVRMLHAYLSANQPLYCVLACEGFAKRHGVDFYGLVREKMTYNASRPHRHGGKRA